MMSGSDRQDARLRIEGCRVPLKISCASGSRLAQNCSVFAGKLCAVACAYAVRLGIGGKIDRASLM
jgi:hypothetical protein